MQSKNLFLTIFEPRSSIVKSGFDCRLSGGEMPHCNIRLQPSRSETKTSFKHYVNLDYNGYQLFSLSLYNYVLSFYVPGLYKQSSCIAQLKYLLKR